MVRKNEMGYLSSGDSMKDALILLRIIGRWTRNQDYSNTAVIEDARETLRRAKLSVGICQVIPSTERRVLRNKWLFVCLFVCLSVCLSPGQKNIVGKDTNCDNCRWCQGYFNTGNSNPRSVRLESEWLLGNRYTQISSKRPFQTVLRGGELESEVRFPRTTMVARQPIHPDFTGKGFP
jgi:hypothetical protein